VIKKLIDNIKIYLLVFAAISAIGIISGAYIKGRIDGINACERASEKAVKKESKRQRKSADDLREMEKQRDAKINERVVYVKQKIKPGSCLAADAPDDILNDLGLRQPSDSRRKRSEAG